MTKDRLREQLNHKNTTLAVAAIVAAAALTGVAFGTLQQVMAGGYRHDIIITTAIA